MLNDSIRMTAYEKAIKEVVKPGMTVLDIGTGTGILALWALKAGAKKVYAIELMLKLLASQKLELQMPAMQITSNCSMQCHMMWSYRKKWM